MITITLGFLRRAATWWRVVKCRSIKTAGRQIHIGEGCRFWACDSITIGDQTYIGKEVNIETNADIGRYVLIANRVAMVGRHDHEYTRLGVPIRFGRWVGAGDADPSIAAEGVVVEDDVWLGFGAIVLSGVRIGRGAIVAAGALVASDVDSYDVVAGVPAKRLGRRFPSADQIAEHELRMSRGEFNFSERGYEHWVVRPGDLR